MKSIFIETDAKAILEECVQKANDVWKHFLTKSDIAEPLFEKEGTVITLLKKWKFKQGSQGQKEGQVQETNGETGRDTGAGQQGGRGLGEGGGRLVGGFRNSGYAGEIADSQGGAASAWTGKGKEWAVDIPGGCGSGKKSERNELESAKKGLEEREKEKESGYKTRREDVKEVVQEGFGGRVEDSVFQAENRAEKAGSVSAESDGSDGMARAFPAQFGDEAQESNEELEGDSSAGQQSKKGLGGVGREQGGEASAMAVKGKKRAVNLPTSNPRFKVGDQVEAKSTLRSSGGQTQKSRKYYPGKISVALGCNGRYGVKFDDGATDEVRDEHLRPKISAVSDASAMGGAFEFKCPGCSQVCFLANTCM